MIIVFYIVFLVLDLDLSMQLPNMAMQDALGTLGDIARAIFQSCIWIPYMLVSKRVKATFVK